MSDNTRTGDRDRLLEAALRASGRRPRPSAAGTARAYEQAQREWQRVVGVNLSRQRTHRAWWVRGLLAASFIGAAIIFFGKPRTDQAPEATAVVMRIEGNARVAAPGSGTATLRADGVVSTGSTIETDPDGRVALQLAGGESLRLDRGTRMRIVDATAFRLERGQIYIDTGSRAVTRAIRIFTPLALLTDAGTQFQVEWHEDLLRVRVREGRVSVGESGFIPNVDTVSAGQVMSLRRDQAPSLRSSDSFGPAWAWVADISPGPDVDELGLEPILQWICRELGCHLRYADARTREMVGAVVLDGSLEGLTPDEAFDVVRRITKFEYRLEAGELRVGPLDERP